MSVTRLLLSGLMVASGLILAALTLHGAFDPHWQMQASEEGEPTLNPWITQISRASKAQPSDAKAMSAKARKRLEDKRRAVKRMAEQAEKAKQPPQQAAAWWPW